MHSRSPVLFSLMLATLCLVAGSTRLDASPLNVFEATLKITPRVPVDLSPTKTLLVALTPQTRDSGKTDFRGLVGVDLSHVGSFSLTGGQGEPVGGHPGPFQPSGLAGADYAFSEGFAINGSWVANDVKFNIANSPTFTPTQAERFDSSGIAVTMPFTLYSQYDDEPDVVTVDSEQFTFTAGDPAGQFYVNPDKSFAILIPIDTIVDYAGAQLELSGGISIRGIVPEPSSAILAVSGLLGILMYVRRRPPTAATLASLTKEIPRRSHKNVGK